MKLKQLLALFTNCGLLLEGSGCRTSDTPIHPEQISTEKVSKTILEYRLMDQGLPLFDSLELPSPILHRFVQAWNSSGTRELIKSAPRYTIHVQLKDGERRIFRLNGKHAKEQDDWSLVLGDTLLEASLDSLREINERWFGRYYTENGAVLSLYRNGKYNYFMNQCTHGYSSEGVWSIAGDTLRLVADPEPKRKEGPITDRFEWASFDEPFVRNGQILYFTVEGDLNYHHFFTKE